MKAKIENLNTALVYRLENGPRAAIFWLLVSLAGVLTVLYLYFLTSSVFNVAWRGNAEVKISILRSNVSELESNYLASLSSLDMGKAESLGLKEFNKQVFASSGEGEKLSFNSKSNF